MARGKKRKMSTGGGHKKEENVTQGIKKRMKAGGTKSRTMAHGAQRKG